MIEFIREVFSCFSRLLNVLTGGTADVTFSARSHADSLWTEGPIDGVFRLFGGDDDHCYKWWKHDVMRARKLVAFADLKET